MPKMHTVKISSQLAILLINFINYRATQQTILTALGTSNSAFEEALNQHITWTPEAAAALETSIRSGPIYAGCATDETVTTIFYKNKKILCTGDL